MRVFAPIFFLLVYWDSAFAQLFVLSGTVRDAETHQPLVAAAVRIAGSSKGTIANAQGEYRISLEGGEYKIAFSYVGYRPETLSVRIERNRELNVQLVPTPIQMAEVVISGEDPALAIMRQVIENKTRWMKSLRTYQFEAFTRQTIRRDTSIAGIAETYSTGYWQQGDTLREVIKQKRQTQNIPSAANFAGVGAVINFYLDEIRFSGFTFIGPTSPDAFDYYNFKLEKTRESNGIRIFTIQLNPKSRLTPLFRGSIEVVDERFVLAGVDVMPNEAYVIPFVTDLKIRYSQHFALYEDRYWMPVELRLVGSAEIGIAGFSFPRIGFESLSSIYDYKINIELPDTIFKKPRRIQAAESSKFDSLFWAQHEVLPLTKEEQLAYQKLDSTETFERQFQPGGPLAALGEVSSFLKYGSLRFNRVEGLYAGGNLELDSAASFWKVYASLGYGVSDKRYKWNAGSEFFLSASRSLSLGAEMFDGIGHFVDEEFHSDFSITFSTLLSKVDYRDYYYLRGWRIYTRARPIPSLSFSLAVQEENHSSAVQTTNYSFLYRDVNYRPNPAAQDGLLRSISFKGRYGEEPVPLNIISRNFIEFEMEKSSSSLLKSDFEFSRFLLRTEYRFTTYQSRVLFPPALRLRLVVGTSDGLLPVQRVSVLDSPLLGFGPFGVLHGAGVKEFGGERFVLLTVEHNFRNTPFLVLNIPFLYKNSIEVIVHASVAQSWVRSNSTSIILQPTNGWYTETGLGISRIFGLLRLDITRRFKEPAGTFLTISLANIL
jgi:hypothetical protein